MITKISDIFKRADINHRLSFPRIINPENLISNAICEVKCPVNGCSPVKYLFSSHDTRFGDKRIHDIFYCSTCKVAVTSPYIENEALTYLHQKFYSNSTPIRIIPSKDTFSPYKKYKGGRSWYHLALLRKAPSFKVSWKDETASEILKMVGKRYGAGCNKISFLDIGCFDGTLLSDLQKHTNWELSGIEPNHKAASKAQRRGFKVWIASIENAGGKIIQKKFDIIYLGQTIEHINNPLRALKKLNHLLKPKGELVISTPNLDSVQIDLFGPTWSHWHPPYHRYIFSPHSLKNLAIKARLVFKNLSSHSHPYWSALSLQLNCTGLAGVIPHGIETPGDFIAKAENLSAWSKLLWNWRGLGDYFYMSFKKGKVITDL